MPFPTTRYTLPNVDCARGERPGAEARTHSQIDSLLWRCELGHRQVRIQPVRNLRCQDVRNVSQAFTSPTNTWQAHGDRPGQRQIPPRQAACAATAHVSQSTHAAVPASIQPTTRPHRARLETHATFGNPQPVFRHPERRPRGGRAVLHAMVKTKCNIETIMRHYLRRYV